MSPYSTEQIGFGESWKHSGLLLLPKVYGDKPSKGKAPFFPHYKFT